MYWLPADGARAGAQARRALGPPVLYLAPHHHLHGIVCGRTNDPKGEGHLCSKGKADIYIYTVELFYTQGVE